MTQGSAHRPVPPVDDAARHHEVGDIVELSIGPAAHGGHCVARLEGRVVFVRHTIPGERVRARLTSVARSSMWRADAVEILDPSPDRVPSVWPEAGPGGVGGGELAHVSLAGQRRWKAAVIRDQFARIAHLDLAERGLDLTVEGVAQDESRNGLGWRTRVDLVAGGDGKAGMRATRSHDVVQLAEMPLATDAVSALLTRERVFQRGWRPGTRIEAAVPAAGGPGVLLVDGEPWRRGRRDTRANARRSVTEMVPAGVARERRIADGALQYRVAAAGFWQVHEEAPRVLVDAVLDVAHKDGGWRGLHVADLYSGAGLLSLPLALAVGSEGRVLSVEGDARAVRDARRNLHAFPQVEVHHGDIASVLARQDNEGSGSSLDVVVLDPPRSGAGREVVERLAANHPGTVVYVACDPAALARDVGLLEGLGYRLVALRAFDLFPTTHHVECVATFSPTAKT